MEDNLQTYMATELIEDLERAIKTYGDRDVVVKVNSSFFNVNNLTFSTRGNYYMLSNNSINSEFYSAKKLMNELQLVVENYNDRFVKFNFEDRMAIANDLECSSNSNDFILIFHN